MSKEDIPPLYDYGSTTTFALDSDSDDETELSNEAKRIMKKRKKEKEKLAKLGKLVPIDTSSESVDIAAGQSQALPLPLREKMSELSVMTKNSKISTFTARSSDHSSMGGSKSNFPDPSNPRVSKSVAFGNVEQSEFRLENSDQPETSTQPDRPETTDPEPQTSSQSCPAGTSDQVGSHFDLLQQYIEESKKQLEDNN